jgi:hypothetical protein
VVAASFWCLASTRAHSLGIFQVHFTFTHRDWSEILTSDAGLPGHRFILHRDRVYGHGVCCVWCLGVMNWPALYCVCVCVSECTNSRKADSTAPFVRGEWPINEPIMMHDWHTNVCRPPPALPSVLRSPQRRQSILPLSQPAWSIHGVVYLLTVSFCSAKRQSTSQIVCDQRY